MASAIAAVRGIFDNEVQPASGPNRRSRELSYDDTDDNNRKKRRVWADCVKV